MKDFIKKLTGFSIGPIIGAIISFITIPITTYFIIPEEYGKVTMFTLVQSVLAMVVYLGLDQAYTRFYNDESDKKKLLFNSIIIPLTLSIMVVFIVPFNAGKISQLLFEDGQYIIPVYMLMVTIPLLIIERFILLSIRMKEKAFQYSAYSILLKLIVFFATLFFIFAVRKDFLAIVYSAIIGQIIGDIILIIIYRKEITLNLKYFDKDLMKSLIKFGLPLLIVSIIGWALNSMDKVFIRMQSTFEQLGYYGIAMKIANLLLIVQNSFTAFWVPTAYRWHKESVEKSKFSLVSDVLALVMSLLFMVILTLKGLLPILISENYRNAIYIMPFLLFYPIMYTISETTTLGITFSKKSYLNIIVSILAILVNLVFNYLLTPKYASAGAAIATGLSYIVFFWARTVISRRLWYKFEIKKFIFLTAILMVAAFCNTFVQNNNILIINVICIILLLCVYKDTIKYLLKIFKKYISDKKIAKETKKINYLE